MEETNKTEIRPVIVWESVVQDSKSEATLQIIRTGQPADTAAPVIRVFSSGFGQKHTASTGKGIRMAA